MEEVADHREHILLFDGVCNVCHWSVNFVLDRDPQGLFSFASLQSPAGQRILQKAALPSDLQSVVYVHNDEVYVRSEAVLRVLKIIGGWWGWLLFMICILIPAFIRDWGYDIFAANRYRLFGHADACRMQTKAIRRRFLPDHFDPSLASSSREKDL